MRFLKNIFKMSKRKKCIVTEEEIDEQLKKYYEYKNESLEDSTIEIVENYQFNDIIDQVSDQIYINNVDIQDNEYNEYESEEEIWTRLQAS